MNKGIIVAIIAVIVIGGGYLFYQSQQQATMQADKDKMMQEDGDGAMMEKDGEAMEDEGMMMEGYSGKVLAGKSSPLVEFNQADYEAALSSDKVVLLYFYANWCPICRVENPIAQEVFNGLTTDQVVGFQVNFNDSDTDEEEKALADEYNVTYQHTKVILKDGQEFSRSGEPWEEADFNSAINAAL